MPPEQLTDEQKKLVLVRSFTKAGNRLALPRSVIEIYGICAAIKDCGSLTKEQMKELVDEVISWGEANEYIGNFKYPLHYQLTEKGQQLLAKVR